MTPSRPYFVRAVYEWLNDNRQTPFVLIDATRAGVVVPAAYVKDGRIVLNIAPGAVRDLFIHNDDLSFSARFGGVPMVVHAPMAAVLAIYSKEDGQGMFFEADEYPAAGAPAAGDPADAPGPVPAATSALAVVPAPALAPQSAATATTPEGEEPEPPRPGGRPSLRVVK